MSRPIESRPGNRSARSGDIEAFVADLAQRYATQPSVLAVTLGGSRTTGVEDPDSDVDLYVYDVRGQVPLDVRRAIAADLADATRAIEIGNTTWEPGDEWVHPALGVKVDTMFRSPQWIGEQLDNVLVHHRGSPGYSTCFWYNVVNARILYQRDGWYTTLRQRADVPYPDALVGAIVGRNYPLIRGCHSSYRTQIALAVARRDRVSVLHRTTALIASYFDILFAVNRQPHPGEKRLLFHVDRLCRHCPSDVAGRVDALLTSVAAPWGQMSILACIDDLADGLDDLLRAQKLIPEQAL